MTTNNIDYASSKKLPVNKSSIDEIIAQNYYYVDKTPFIKELFKLDTCKVVLITRPEHFGKSLAMDTFHKFLRITPDNPKDSS